MPLLIGVLCVMAIAYRFYSAFLAARVATLDDLRTTPAVEFNDGQNFHPTNKWVLFGHHFAAISGAGPLIGPVLAAQFGYLPGLLWIVIGVCLAGAVQDFLVLSMSLRRGGRSLAQIAFSDVGKVAGVASTVAILFILIIALAGLGKVVVKALGGEEVKYPEQTKIVYPPSSPGTLNIDPVREADGITWVDHGATLIWNDGKSSLKVNEDFKVKNAVQSFNILPGGGQEYTFKGQLVRLVPGSSWGTFTIAMTIPIALFVGLYMYKLRPGRVVEASLIGAVLTLVATVVGGMIPGSPLEPFFNMKDTTVIWAMAIYGFIASVLPVWVLLCPRDYLSSFLKIGTIALLVGGVIIANPKMEAPAINHTFLTGGPTVPGNIFPFLFITVMCGSISGFHALVSSGTTPKMVKKEKDARMIGYGAMLIEGLVGVVAMIAAATLPVGDYYAMNTDLAKVPAYHDKFVSIGADIDNLNVYESRTQESLRGRTGGAVTLAVGMAHIFDGIARKVGTSAEATLSKLWKYWYHFAIMFEALFILTTIDTGTRIGRFLLQEVLGKAHPSLGIKGGWFGAVFATTVIVAGWCYFINANNFAAIWAMFGVANQMLAVIALAIVSVYLANSGKRAYLWVTGGPMIVVATTTSTAAIRILIGQWDTLVAQWNSATPSWPVQLNAMITGSLLLLILGCGLVVIAACAMRILGWPPNLVPQGAAESLEVD